MCIRDRYTVFTGPIKGNKNTGEKAATQALQKGKDVETVKKATSTNKNAGPSNVGKLLETEEYAVSTVSHDFKIALQQARQAKGLTQVQLARNVNEKQSVIADYEAGRAIPNPGIISKLERALGVRLPRQKKQKKKEENKEDDQ
eukprot:TRINITY_DN1497_c0_g1_i14.p3 TRINITY_DN1497_c0_g1~~TRINITY_DN1497_c0_g1_i14.p3  ORF type:complete len:144 (+),score=43.79 TRINITY_DN1497_c0_g1_i14:98-529(+)